ncbi:MAG: carboxypeptidase regulatory-like domain-containing protein [Acidobacteriota bacterium]|nr:carboxypeptidase regulatory-like domain-containing protein [Acidobacteriota bacterium]
MKKRFALFLFLAVLSSIFTVSAFAQDAQVKGVCKDENGKLITGAVIEVVNGDNGRKVTAKTDKGGQYYILGLLAGRNYKITLYAADGKTQLWFLNGVLLVSGENHYDLDLAKERAAAMKANGVSAEDLKKVEEAKKSNEKIKGLNGLLAQAREEKKAGDYTAAVATMEQAVAQDQSHDIIYGELADDYSGAKKYPEAEAAYDKAITLAPATSKSLPVYHTGLALALGRQNKFEAAMAECDKTVDLDKTLASQCYFNQGAILTNAGNIDAANAAFDKCIAADPTKADAYYQKGVNLLGKATLGKDNKMIPAPGTVEALNKYLELAPDGKNAATAKDLLTTLGATVQVNYGNAKKGKR